MVEEDAKIHHRLSEGLVGAQGSPAKNSRPEKGETRPPRPVEGQGHQHVEAQAIEMGPFVESTLPVPKPWIATRVGRGPSECRQSLAWAVLLALCAI